MDEAKLQTPTKTRSKQVGTDGLSKKERRALKAAQIHGVGFGKVNPGTGGPEENIPPPQMQYGGHISPGQGAGNLLPIDQWQRYAGPPQGLPHSGPQVGQPQGPLRSGLIQQTDPEVGIRQSSTPLCTAGTNCKQALQQLMMVLTSPSTLEQRQQILHILKANPQMMAAFTKQQQSGPQGGQPQGPLPSGLMQQTNPEVDVRQSTTPSFTAGTGTNQALQQLIMVLKSPSTPEQQQQILHILKANPQLMAAFIKQRQLNLQQQQQQQQAELYPNRMQAQNVQQQQHQQWFKQNQLIMQVQQQHHQQQQFRQPSAYQKSPGIRQPHLGYTNQLQEQNVAPIAGLQLTPPPVSSPPPGGISLRQEHQLIQSVQSPSPITSLQPNLSSNLALSLRQPVPSPCEPQPSPLDLTEMLFGQNGTSLHLHASPASQAQDTGDTTPQD